MLFQPRRTFQLAQVIDGDSWHEYPPVYRQREQRSGSKTGHDLIQPKISEQGLLDELLGQDYTIITFDRAAKEALSPQEMQTWERYGTVFLWIKPEGANSAAYLAFDQWLGGCRRRLLVVRPDRFIKEDRGLSDSASDPEGYKAPDRDSTLGRSGVVIF